MGFVLVRDLNDVFVRSRIDDLENIGSRGQYLGARAPNFDWRAKRYDRLSVEIVGLGFRRDEYTEHGEAQSCSKPFEQCHSFSNTSSDSLARRLLCGLYMLSVSQELARRRFRQLQFRGVY
jgi:hypothetical protein